MTISMPTSLENIAHDTVATGLFFLPPYLQLARNPPETQKFFRTAVLLPVVHIIEEHTGF